MDNFSVLLSVYEKEKAPYLKEALESVLYQSVSPDEILLVEDGPLPRELKETIAAFEKNCQSSGRGTAFRVVPLERNQGLGPALAVGLRSCRNELVARMDTDDIAEQDRFEKQLEYLCAHPEIAACGGFLQEFTEEDPSYSRIKEMPETPEALRKYARFRNPLNHMTVMFRKSVVLAAGNYRSCPLLEDYDLWIRMLSQGAAFYNLQQVLVRMRTGNSFSARRGGWHYFRVYKGLRKMQKEYGLLSVGEYLLSLLFTFGMTVQPKWMRHAAYRLFLRKDASRAKN